MSCAICVAGGHLLLFNDQQSSPPTRDSALASQVAPVGIAARATPP
jgi:hypothetical protein